MKAVYNNWWFAILTIALYALGDVATSVANFAANLKDGATLYDITFKEWVTFGGGAVASLVLCIRSTMSSAWSDAKKQPTSA